MRTPAAVFLFSALAVAIHAQSPGSPAAAGESDESVRLSPFEVSARGDRGYNTANTVGATLLNTAILDTPMSINVLNSEFIHDVAATDPIYAASWISGVTTASNAPGVGQEIIRGQNLNPGTAIRDGVYEAVIATGLVFQDQALIDRVEVIKGPEGTLYGDFSGQGGLINLVTKRPQPFNATSVSAFVGSDEFGGTIYRGVLDTNGVDPDNKSLEYRLVLVGQQGKTIQRWQDSTFIVSPMLLYHFKGGGSTLLRYSYQNPDRGLGLGTWFTDAAGTYSTFINRYTAMAESESDAGDNVKYNTVDFELNQPFTTGPIHWDARYFFRYNHMDDLRIQYTAPSAGVQFLNAAGTVIGNQSNLTFANPAIATMEFASRSRSQNVNYIEGANNNFHAVGKFDLGPTTNNLLLYGTSLRESQDEYSYSWAYPGLVLYSIVPGVSPFHYNVPTAVEGAESTSVDSDIITTLYSVGAQDNTSFLNDRVNLVVGIRNDHQNQTTFNRLAKTEVPGDIRKGTTHKYGIVVRPIDQISLFYNYSETFSPNGFGTNLTGQSYKLPNLDAWTNEEGAKLAFFHNRLVIGGSYFDTIIGDELVPETQFNSSGTSVLIQVPAGQGVIKGWEGDGTWAVNDNIDLLFGAGNLTSLTQTGLSARNVPIGTNYRLFAKYAFTQGPLRGLYVGGGVQHNGPRALTATNNGYLPAYTTGSGLAGYNWGRHWQIQLNVTNVTNALYPAYGIAVNTIMPSNPRDYSGILTYSY